MFSSKSKNFRSAQLSWRLLDFSVPTASVKWHSFCATIKVHSQSLKYCTEFYRFRAFRWGLTCHYLLRFVWWKLHFENVESKNRCRFSVIYSGASQNTFASLYVELIYPVLWGKNIAGYQFHPVISNTSIGMVLVNLGLTDTAVQFALQYQSGITLSFCSWREQINRWCFAAYVQNWIFI